MQKTYAIALPPLSLGALAVLAAAVLTACGGGDGGDLNAKPGYLGTVRQQSYDGSSDDLLTAGLGKSGLAVATAPSFAVALQPTAAELRRLAIYTNYRAMLDMTAAGGYGTLYGPNVDAQGRVTAGEGRIAGTEYIAFSDDGTGRKNVTLMVQVPDSFDPRKACIITATASGSRGVYGAITTGEWGLKRGCAVAYSDKGTGAAPHDLMNDTVPLIDGTRSTAAAAGKQAAFNAGLTAGELAAFNTATPNRFAFKHAHSGQNPEKDWGRTTLQAVEFAYYVLNERYGERNILGERLRTLKPSNTIVIASSISNGGGAAIAAAEQDSQGLINGVAVSEPAVELPASPGVTVQRGGTALPVVGKTLVDFTSYANLYQSCASLAASVSGSPYAAAFAAGFASTALPIAPNRCAALRTAGLLNATTTAAQAEEALQKLRDYGWEPESSELHASLAAFEVAPAVSVTFANSLSRASVKDNLCGYSYAGATAAGAVTPLAPEALASMFSTGNGVPPSSSVQLINNKGKFGAARDFLSVSVNSGVADWNTPGALCLRNLVTGNDGAARALQAGVDETRRNGNLQGKPAIIVHGRADALLPVNHTTRPYVALNRKVEGAASKLSYVEVTNAQHFDSFIGLPTVLPGYDTRYIPLHVYLNRALDAMYDHLANGKALPPSQVVRTVPRGGNPGQAPAIQPANLPLIAGTPAAADRIEVSAGAIRVPD
ncbi:MULTISPECIES: D-(-)-3-hydroxybutyrate oligomer hydrolase [Comamonas]|uniref:D-(-)-3-hydroxybutyrate oligomer hydrolase n=1 Tax=Comamonas TaxID=283 RepID=UPI00050E386D|nr:MULTISPECIES: D-(-)-3-hydroxybutyrate oligomer hydrolase [Comamonas]KGG91015.1 cytochrome C1 [Comamonas thiooxydans]KGG97697.1 cytochrome C1 [Comamonas thiooxydans]KGH03098.1 cytochrome C1 [Comamonas thiooxydans]KGH10836.1 cytochrome C1 [Comamonas thiooxydans]TZG06531.1 D-(-)-3-hydroxybutyrate oligomer hydrolase [Comamonas thiooxydans]